MAAKNKKTAARLRRKRSVRKRLSGTTARPRLSVYRSNTHTYAQVIDDDNGVTLASASTLSKAIRDGAEGKKKTELATLVGTLIAERCKEKKIETVVFDRNGFIYHGRVKAVADAAREGGLEF
jgi:large subunit ribosomal protein L18